MEYRSPSGSYVSLISLKHIREGVFLRSTVEPAIYRQIAGSAPVEFLKEMKKTIQETEDLLYSDKGISIDQFIHLDTTISTISPIRRHRSLCSGQP